MIKDFFLGVRDSFRDDFLFFKECYQNFKDEKPLIAEWRKKRLKKELTTGWGPYIRSAWPLLLLMFAMFVGGFYLASQQYEQACNEFLVDEVYDIQTYYMRYEIDGAHYNFTRALEQINVEFDNGES